MKIQENHNGLNLVTVASLSCGDVFRYNHNIYMKVFPVTEEFSGNRMTAVGLNDGLPVCGISSQMVENLTDRSTLVID